MCEALRGITADHPETGVCLCVCVCVCVCVCMCEALRGITAEHPETGVCQSLSPLRFVHITISICRK